MIYVQLGAASFTIYTRTKELASRHDFLNRSSALDAALVGGMAGAMAGSLISFGSAREFWSRSTCLGLLY